MLAWLRRRLGVLTILWLCGQGLTLSVFAANLCCLSHEPAAIDVSADADCHAAATSTADHCPMAGANGEPCPMHRGSHPADDLADCVLSGNCGASDTALLSLLSVPGIISPPERSDILELPLDVVVSPVHHARALALSLDPPPPRA